MTLGSSIFGVFLLYILKCTYVMNIMNNIVMKIIFLLFNIINIM